MQSQKYIKYIKIQSGFSNHEPLEKREKNLERFQVSECINTQCLNIIAHAQQLTALFTFEITNH